MRKLLLQLDGSRLASAFDRIVAYDAGADEVLSYGGVAPGDVRALVHGAIFTRGPRDLHNTACFIGGDDVALGERLLAAARDAFFGPMRVSLMLDSNGANTTAVAAVARIAQVTGELSGRRAVVTAGTGPVGTRAAGLLAAAGADVVVTSRHDADGERAAREITRRFGGRVTSATLRAPADAGTVLDGATVLLNAGPAGVRLVAADAWRDQPSLAVVVDLNAVPPFGIDGIEPADDGARRGHAVVFGALGVGGFKMKLHKACVARLFERNDLVLDAEAIAEVARELLGQAPSLPAPGATASGATWAGNPA